MVSEARNIQTYTTFALLDGERLGEQTEGMCPDVTYVAGSSWSVGYKGLSKP